VADSGDFAVQTRDALDLSLRTPGKRYWSATGHVDEAPAIDGRFTVASVTLDSAADPPAVIVRFRWAGADAVYAVAFDAVPSDGAWPRTPQECAGYMSINLQEHIVPYGIGAAERTARDGVVWLSWPNEGFGGRRIASAPENG
jgi:hypothetical protein